MSFLTIRALEHSANAVRVQCQKADQLLVNQA